MGNHSAGMRNGRIRSLLAIVSAVMFAITLLVGLTVSLRAQSSKDQAAATPRLTLQWEIDAGGKMKFDVASAKQDTAVPGAQTVYSNVLLTVGDIEYRANTNGDCKSTEPTN